MTPNDLFLSGMLWFCVGFLIGYRYQVWRVRKIVAARAHRIWLEWRDCSIRELLKEVEKHNKRDSAARIP